MMSERPVLQNITGVTSMCTSEIDLLSCLLNLSDLSDADSVAQSVVSAPQGVVENSPSQPFHLLVRPKGSGTTQTYIPSSSFVWQENPNIEFF